jgi:transposase
MFARISRSKKKSGIYEYLVISESIHIKGKGSTTRDIANLGNIKKFNSNDIDNIIDGLIRIFKSEKYALSDQVKILESLEHGSIIFWQQLWARLQLSETIKKLIKSKSNRIEIDVAKYVEMMVINRCADPLSKLATSRWIDRTCYKVMKGYHNLNMNVEYFYRSMDYLLSIKDDLEHALYTKLKSLFSINVKLTFYDITSTFFHTESCPIGKKGFSRDHRQDKEQIVIGVVTSWEGYPIKHYVFEGNTKDEKTVINVVKQLKKEFHIEETTFVGDRGMITKLNLSTIENEGYSYIMGVKHRQSEIHEMLLYDDDNNKKLFEEYKNLQIHDTKLKIKDFILWKITQILLKEGIKTNKEVYNELKKEISYLNNSLTKVKYDGIRNAITPLTEDKKIRSKISALIRKYIGQYDNIHRSIICLNAERKETSKKKREEKVLNISESLSKLFNQAGQAKEENKSTKIEVKLNEYFRGYNRRYKKYFKILRDKDDNAIGYEVNKIELLDEEKFDGIFILTTNNEELSARDIVDAYKNLQEVEILFDDLKHFVDIHPVRHWLEYRVRAHVCICILALLLKRIFEIDCLKGKAMIEALEEIGKSKLTRYEVKYSEKEDRRQVLPKITQCTDLQKQIFKLVGVKNPMSLERFVW